MFAFLDINRAFGRFYNGIHTDVYLFIDQPSDGVGYLVRFNPETGAVTCEVC